MTSTGWLGRTPYFFLAPRPFREQRLAAYIRRQHRRGRHLAEILDDPYVHRCGSEEFIRATMRDTRLIELLMTDMREDFENSRP